MDSSFNFVDDFTLQTFMNKSNYDKYLMKHNEKKYKEKVSSEVHFTYVMDMRGMMKKNVNSLHSNL